MSIAFINLKSPEVTSEEIDMFLLEDEDLDQKIYDNLEKTETSCSVFQIKND
jgi:hypothetical protein